MSLRYDATTSVRSIADRVPDAHGWYRRAPTVTFVGGDAVSGLLYGARPLRRSHHQSAASLVGSCRDAAGNAAEVTHRFQYDATALKLRKAEGGR